MSSEKLRTGDIPVPDVEYKWIRKWGEMFSYPEYYTENAIMVARRDGAPQNAIYKHDGGVWATTDDIVSLTVRMHLGLETR